MMSKYKPTIVHSFKNRIHNFEETFKDQMPYTVMTGETADPTEWLNDKLSSLELRDIFSTGDNSNYFKKEEDDA